jgi:hypothetical protein
MQVSFKGNDPELSSITPTSGYSCLKVSQLEIKVAASGKGQHRAQKLFGPSPAKKKRPEPGRSKPDCSFAKRLFGGWGGASVAGALLALFPALMALLSAFVPFLGAVVSGRLLGAGAGALGAGVLREGQTAREQ